MRLNTDIARRIVDRVAAGLDKQVGVVDAAGRILASTDERLVGLRLPSAERAIERGAAVEDGEQLLAGISLPLTYAGAVVGAIVLGDMSPQGRELGQVARTLAELIIHQMTVIERLPRQTWIRDKLVADLLDERSHTAPEVLLHEAELLGIDLNVPRFVIVIDFGPLTDRLLQTVAPSDSLPAITRALRLDQIHTQLLEQLRSVVAPNDADVYGFLDDHRLVVLAALDPTAPQSRRLQIAGGLQRFLAELAGDARAAASAGVGWHHPGWRALAQSCVEAQCALETGASLYGPGRVFQIEDLGMAGFVCSDSQAMKSELAWRLLQPLDGEPELLATLETFLRSNLSPSAAAQALHIHRHTLAYRLDKIAQLTGRDPRTFDAAAQLYAAVMLRKAGNPAAGGRPPSASPRSTSVAPLSG